MIQHCYLYQAISELCLVQLKYFVSSQTQMKTGIITSDSCLIIPTIFHICYVLMDILLSNMPGHNVEIN